jgi:hypothetical protein
VRIQTSVKKLILLVLLAGGSAFAADVDGKWSGNMSTPGGDVPVGFTFQADGATLNGTTTGPDGMEVKISDGKLDGSNLSFSVKIDFGGMPVVLNYKGVLSAGQIKFTLDVFGMPFEVTVKKVS